MPSPDADILRSDDLLPATPATWANNRLHFFKYTSGATAEIVVKTGKIRWSTPKLFNDPFDMQVGLGLDFDRDTTTSRILSELWAIYRGETLLPAKGLGAIIGFMRRTETPLSRDAFEAIFKPGVEEGLDVLKARAPETMKELAPSIATCKVLCLTGRPNNRLMWSHYADQHRGVVLRFRSIPAFDSAFGTAKPVRYVDHTPPLLDVEEVVRMVVGAAPPDHETVLDRHVYYKSKEWDYEEEWRINASDGRDRDADYEDVSFYRNELDGIIFGMRAPDALIATLSAASRVYPNVDLFQCRPTAGYGLGFAIIDPL